MYHSLLGLALILLVACNIIEKESLNMHDPKKYRHSQHMLIVTGGLIAAANIMALVSNDPHAVSALTCWLLAFVVTVLCMIYAAATDKPADADTYYQIGCLAHCRRFTFSELLSGTVLTVWPLLIAWLWIWTLIKWLLR